MASMPSTRRQQDLQIVEYAGGFVIQATPIEIFARLETLSCLYPGSRTAQRCLAYRKEVLEYGVFRAYYDIVMYLYTDHRFNILLIFLLVVWIII